LKESIHSVKWFHFLAHLSRKIDRQIDAAGEHSTQVAFLARSTAALLGFSPVEMQSIYWAARLHDIGKVAVPARLLCKSGPLSEREWQIMRLHPAIGANIVEGFPEIAHLAPWIYHHQEKYDGSGYPEGLRGEQIPLPARLLTVVDAYDAMTNDRCYRPALSPGHALSELRAKGGQHFDPQVVAVFLRVIRENKRGQPFLTGSIGAMD
jgi:putative nucleotidyltransferase with HDIG domain